MPRAPWDSPDYIPRLHITQDGEEFRLIRQECSQQFWDLMKNRMLVSYYKYGKVEDAMVPKGDGPPKIINAVASAELRLQKYRDTKNVEYLVDAANFLMMEFMYPQHPGAYFKATDSDQSPGRIEHSSGEAVPFANRDLL